MTEAMLADPVLARIKRDLEALYGPRLKRVLLYGSRARGDYREDSDYDVLVVLEEPFHWWTEVKRMGEISWDVLMDTGEVISLKPVRQADLDARTGFMHNVREEARPL